MWCVVLTVMYVGGGGCVGGCCFSFSFSSLKALICSSDVGLVI